MNKRSRRFVAMDVLLILGMILPLVAGIVLKILTYLPSEDITVTGARIFFKIPLPLGGLPITESQVNSALVLLSLFFCNLEKLGIGFQERCILPPFRACQILHTL